MTPKIVKTTNFTEEVSIRSRRKTNLGAFTTYLKQKENKKQFSAFFETETGDLGEAKTTGYTLSARARGAD
ncbi:hypothetical protein DSO57_1017972 [Entomophthora muscae]|uniref:Uncharacterized protein n=1 Tax=Entomophthora muscae TaxID=34485 RepID=A0ACC2T4S5_9FUNG|nr:hypothetical protein DSO57_1017972 [Entomophthora muscae]